MYSCDEPRYTVSAAPDFLMSTDDLKDAIRATKRCLADYGRCEFHDNESGQMWTCKSPEKKP